MDHGTQISKEELQQLGIQVVTDYLRQENHTILSYNSKPDRDPQIIADIHGHKGFITIRTVHYPEKAMIDEEAHHQQLSLARQFNATAYFAGVSIVTCEKAASGEILTPVNGTSHQAIFDGMNILFTSANAFAAELPMDTNPQKLEACRAYARMINNQDISHLIPWLADNFQAGSQLTWNGPLNKQEYLDYIASKMKGFRENPSYSISAEIAYTAAFGAGPCVILTQQTIEFSQFTYLIELQDGKIKRSTMCILPSADQCKRTGEFPV